MTGQLEHVTVFSNVFNANHHKEPLQFEFLLACMILLTMASVQVFLPGRLLIALTILSSAFRLSCKFVPLE